MTVERPCDCEGRHREFAPHPAGGTQIVPAIHQHEDDLCSPGAGAVAGCPGLPYCRDWIIGGYRAGETLAEICGDKLRWFGADAKRSSASSRGGRRSRVRSARHDRLPPPARGCGVPELGEPHAHRLVARGALPGGIALARHADLHRDPRVVSRLARLD